MAKIRTLRVLEHEFGQILKYGSTSELLYYSAEWDEIFELAKDAAIRQNLALPSGDVRSAGYALDVIGVPNEFSAAHEDEQGDWIVYWR